MSGVKRYEAAAEFGNPVMSEYAFGDYVSYEDYVALIEERDALAANEGYKRAFYEIADILGIGARPNSPKDVFEQVIKPMLINFKEERDALAVKLPDACGYEHPEKEDPFYTLNKDEVIAAIRAAGYEVEE